MSGMGGTGTVAGVARTCVRGSSTAAGKTGCSAVDLDGVRGRSVTEDGAKSRSVKRSRLNGDTPALTNPAATFRARDVLFFKGPYKDNSKGSHLCEQ